MNHLSIKLHYYFVPPINSPPYLISDLLAGLISILLIVSFICEIFSFNVLDIDFVSLIDFCKSVVVTVCCPLIKAFSIASFITASKSAPLNPSVSLMRAIVSISLSTFHVSSSEFLESYVFLLH